MRLLGNHHLSESWARGLTNGTMQWLPLCLVVAVTALKRADEIQTSVSQWRFRWVLDF